MNAFIDALAELGFSFWQIVVLLIAYLFRNELRALLHRVTSVKLGDKEVSFSRSAGAVKELRLLREHLAGNGDQASNAQIIDSAIEKRLIGSLIFLKYNTEFLWPALKSRGMSLRVKAPLLRTTFYKIADALDNLTVGELLSYCVDDSPVDLMPGKDEVTIVVDVQSPRLDELIKKADEY